MFLTYVVLGVLLGVALAVWGGFLFERWTQKECDKNEEADLQRAILKANYKEKR